MSALKTTSKEYFYTNYVKKKKPLILEKATEDWPAYQKWKLNYIKEIAGDKTVPLYNDRHGSIIKTNRRLLKFTKDYIFGFRINIKRGQVNFASLNFELDFNCK